MNRSGSVKPEVEPLREYIEGTLRRPRVWVPLVAGMAAFLAGLWLDGLLPRTFWWGLGAALLVWSVLQLVGDASDSVTPLPQRFDTYLAVGLLVAAGWVACWLKFELDGLGLVGAIVAYVAVGHLLLKWQRNMRGRPRRGVLILGLCAALFLISWQLLVPGDNKSSEVPKLAIGLLAASVLVAPVGLSLLSEDVIERVRERSPRVQWVLAGLGLALLIVPLVVLIANLDEIYTPLRHRRRRPICPARLGHGGNPGRHRRGRPRTNRCGGLRTTGGARSASAWRRTDHRRPR